MPATGTADLKIQDMTFHANKWVTTRVRNVLCRNGIETLSDLLDCSLEELQGLQGFGAISAAHVVAKLDDMGLNLRQHGW